MSLRKLPVIQAFTRPDNVPLDMVPDVEALDKWTPLAAQEDSSTISIYEVIGEDYWTGGGFTAKRMSAALRSIGNRPVTISINSPGGDFFEGLAIYNLLREHPAEVNVKVMGLAASAASIIAMAGDTVSMGLGSFLMIHNAWGGVVGNRHDFTAAAELFSQFDSAMVDIYAARTALDAKAIGKLMDAESFLTARQSVDQGFADEVTNESLPAAASASTPHDIMALRRHDSILAKQGVPRSERRRTLQKPAGTHDAAGDTTTPGAGFDSTLALQLIAMMKN